jgi:hypothetical protein
MKFHAFVYIFFDVGVLGVDVGVLGVDFGFDCGC